MTTKKKKLVKSKEDKKENLSFEILIKTAVSGNPKPRNKRKKVNKK